MDKLLHAMYDHFYTPPDETELRQEIEACHQALIKTLSKEERRTVLKIIDSKDQIAETMSIDSFIQGFLLAFELNTELSHYATRTRRGGKNR